MKEKRTRPKLKRMFKHDSVCKSFLAGCCPFDPDHLGGKRQFKTCEKIHSELMKDQFDSHPEAPVLKIKYMIASIPDFEYAISECNARVAEEQKRINEEWDRKEPIDRIPVGMAAKIAELKSQSLARMTIAEKNIDDADKRRLMKEADELTKEVMALEAEETEKAKTYPPEEKCCEVCGMCYRGGEGMEESHKKMNIYKVYKKIRDRLELLKKTEQDEAEKVKKEREEKDKKREEERAEKEKKREEKKAEEEKEKGEGKERRRVRSRSRSRRGRGKDDRDQSRGRGRDRDDSRPRGRGRDRSRDRGRGRDPPPRRRDESRSRNRGGGGRRR